MYIVLNLFLIILKRTSERTETRDGRRLFLICIRLAYRGRAENIFSPIVSFARSGSRTRYRNHLLKEIRAKLNFSSRWPPFNDDNRKDEDCREYYICIFYNLRKSTVARKIFFRSSFLSHCINYKNVLSKIEMTVLNKNVKIWFYTCLRSKNINRLQTQTVRLIFRWILF